MTRKLIALTLCVAFLCAVGLTGCAKEPAPAQPAEGDAPTLMPPPMPTSPAMPAPPAPPTPVETVEEEPAEGQ